MVTLYSDESYTTTATINSKNNSLEIKDVYVVEPVKGVVEFSESSIITLNEDSVKAFAEYLGTTVDNILETLENEFYSSYSFSDIKSELEAEGIEFHYKVVED